MLTLIMIATLAAAPTSRPAGESASAQPTSQPARTLARYYGLVKNEFMHDEDGRVIVLPEPVKKAVADIRKNAAEEKREVDADIAALGRDITKADADRRKHEQEARAERKEARASERRSVHYSYNTLNGRVVGVSANVDGGAVDAAKDARRRADARKDRARAAQGDIGSMRAELMQLKKESAALAVVASDRNRNLPPKAFWADLPEDMQKQLGRVGITQDEFKIFLLTDCRLTEAQFLDEAVRIDQRTRAADDLADGLMKYLGDRLPKPAAAPAKPAPAPLAVPGRPLGK